MAKKITVNDKLISKIERKINERLCLSNVTEFQEKENYPLFHQRPERWTELENTLCEYTERIRFEIIRDITELLKNGDAR